MIDYRYDAPSLDTTRVQHALELLRFARDQLKAAECPNTLARVRAAIESCEGALRNQAHRDAYPDRKRVKLAKGKAKRRPVGTVKVSSILSVSINPGAPKVRTYTSVEQVTADFGARQWQIRADEPRTDQYTDVSAACAAVISAGGKVWVPDDLIPVARTRANGF